MDMLNVDVEVVRGEGWNEWWAKYERLSVLAESIRRRLQNGNLSPNKRAKLQWQLTHLEEKIIPRHLSQQPSF